MHAMFSLNFLRQSSATPKESIAPIMFHRLVLGAALLVAHAGNAQNMPAATSRPTGDQLLYGKHSLANCRIKVVDPTSEGLTANTDVTINTDSAIHSADQVCLSRRERRLARHRYQDLHREEFPSVYQPGIE